MTENKKQLNNFTLFTSTNEETLQVASELKKIGCCPRCVLRFLGESNPFSFRSQPQDLAKILNADGNEDVDWSNSCPCPGCLGILQNLAGKDFLFKIVDKVKEDGYSFVNYQCSLMLPVCLLVRQKALFCHLRNKFGVVYSGKETSIPMVKDVWKWACGPPLTEILEARFQNQSQFDIRLTFDYADSEKECSFLLDVDPETFRKRKQRKYGFETFTRSNVLKAIDEMSDSKFEDCVSCPPTLPVKESSCAISCSHDSVFVAGRYQKYSRTLSQTPWIVDGKRIFEGSVEDFICDPMTEMFKPTERRLSSSGREDVDVRMLGTGRPFVIELINPHCVKFTPADVKALQKKINESTRDVQVRDLQIVPRIDLTALKEGEIDKKKSYSAICWCERELTQEDLDLLTGMKDLTIHQKTPLRVLHRRSAMTRDRIIHSLIPEMLEGNRFKLSLHTQAGTYIKEFVHGDFGRTSPNLCDLLKAECDIIDLDVEAVDVDWPPFIDPIPEVADKTQDSVTGVNSISHVDSEIQKPVASVNMSMPPMSNEKTELSDDTKMQESKESLTVL